MSNEALQHLCTNNPRRSHSYPEQHVSIPHHQVTEDFFEEGKIFNGSSIAGWKGIQDSDMVLSTATLDPFTDDITLNLRCDVLDPKTMLGYGRDPRSVAKRTEAYMRSTGIADTILFGPDPKFFLFDDVKYDSSIAGAFSSIDAKEAAWNSGTSYKSVTLLAVPVSKAVISQSLQLMRHKISVRLCV